jgi:hypothetical protein
MATIVLPTSTDETHYTFEISLEGVPFLFEFYWNARDASWVMSISDVAGTPLLMGRKVTLGTLLLTRFRNPALPLGELQAVDTSGANVEAQVNDLGTRVQLLYFESADIPNGWEVNV